MHWKSTIMTKLIRIIPLLVLFLTALVASEAGAMNSILNLRHWVAPDHTRIVIDTSEGPEYTVEKNKEYVRIDFKNTVYPKDLPDQFVLNKPGVTVITMTHLSEESVRIEISLADHVDTNVFKLSKIEEKPDRVVIDIELPDIEKKETTKREQVKIERKEWIVVIDPGHGGEDPGAVGRGGTQEKDVVLRVSRMLKDNLNKRGGYRAFLTRNGDYYVAFKKRLKIAREYGADLFLSIHADAARNRDAQGASVYCLSPSGASTEAARLLAMKENLADIMGGSPNGENSDASDPIVLNMFQTNTINTSRIFGGSMLSKLSRVSPLKFDTVQGAPFRVLKLPQIPSLLVETGYISNKKEEKLLRSNRHQARIANALAKAVEEILPAEPAVRPVPGVVVTKKEPESKPKGVMGDRPETGTKNTDVVKEEVKVREAKSQYYTVKRGDTLEKIAKKHNTTLAALLKLNQMRLKDPLFVDRKIKIAALNKTAAVPSIVPAVPEVSSEAKKAGQFDATKPATDIFIYKVQRGDTLAKIAQKHATPLNELLKINRMKLKDPLLAGRMIKIKERPAGKETRTRVTTGAPTQTGKEKFTYYRVKKGETLEIIARRNGTTISQLRQLNRMKPSDPLLADRKLKLPLESSL
jgi:N-acetylmuramoyl-L-alanine amidase